MGSAAGPFTILYVCTMGFNRSAVLEAYTNHFAKERGLYPRVTAVSAGADGDGVDVVRRRRGYLAKFIRNAHGRGHRRYTALGLREGQVHPIATALLLEEGVPEILDVRLQPVTEALLERADLVLAVGASQLSALPAMLNGKAHRVRDFTGSPAGQRDIVEPPISFRRPSKAMEAYFALYEELRADAGRVLDHVVAARTLVQE